VVGLLPLIFSGHGRLEELSATDHRPSFQSSLPITHSRRSKERSTRMSYSSTCKLVLTDRSALTAGAGLWRPFRAKLGAWQTLVPSSRCCWPASAGANMPFHMVEDDIERGRFERSSDRQTSIRVSLVLVMGCANLTGDRLGPGARWLIERLRSDPGAAFSTRLTGTRHLSLAHGNKGAQLIDGDGCLTCHPIVRWIAAIFQSLPKMRQVA